MTDSQIPKYATFQDWMEEIEGYSARAERVPDGAIPWLIEAWKLGAASAAKSPPSRQENDDVFPGFRGNNDGS